MRWALFVALLLGSCRSLGPPPPKLQAVLEQRELEREGSLRRVSRIDVLSPWFSGEFKVVAVQSGGETQRVRFQLLPDFGGKILDVVVHPDAVVATWPHSGEVVRERTALIGFLAISLMENASELSWQRVMAGRTTQEGFLVQVKPASRGLDLDVRVDLDRSGRVLARHYQLGSVGWSEEFEPVHRFLSRNFEWTFLEETSAPISSPPEKLFALPDPDEDSP